MKGPVATFHQFKRTQQILKDEDLWAKKKSGFHSIKDIWNYPEKEVWRALKCNKNFLRNLFILSKDNTLLI